MNVTLFKLDIIPATEPGDQESRLEIELDRVGFVPLFGSNKAVEARVRGADVRMAKLSEAESWLWFYYLPLMAASIADMLLHFDMHLKKDANLYVPWQVIRRYERVRRLQVFDGLQFRVSPEVNDCIFYGYRKIGWSNGPVWDVFMLAHWNTEGDPMPTISDIKKWLLQRSTDPTLGKGGAAFPKGTIKRLCEAHNQSLAVVG